MTISLKLQTLAHYMTGEFDNREQALAEPVWFVHLRLWQQPTPLFGDDSITLFAEQASSITPDLPYRQRIMRLSESATPTGALQVQYYALKRPATYSGAGRDPQKLQSITTDDLEELPGCLLHVTEQALSAQAYRFTATPPAETRCCFSYQGEARYVSLGFEASADEFLSYDKGIDPETGKALWGAILGPFRFLKRTP